MGSLDGKVAFITGAARGQGRSHAVRLAHDGADIIAIDLCGPLESVKVPPAPPLDDLAETKRMVESLGRRIVAEQADVRDIDQLTSVVDAAVEELGRLDIVVANAGIVTFGAKTHKVEAQSWQDMIDVNLTGVWHTVKAAGDHLIASGPGGSIIITSSLAGFKGLGSSAAYTATKHAVVGLMKVLANELGPHGIRVNTVHPNAVDTPMIMNDDMFKLFCPDIEHPTREDARPRFELMNPMGVAWIDPSEVSKVVAWLASDEARYVSGGQIPVDAGAAIH